MLQILVLALILAINNFFGAVSLGAADLDRRARLRVVGLFAAADCGLPLIGILLGAELVRALGPIASYIGAVMIMATALYIFLDPGGSGSPGGKTAMGPLLLMALGLSLDNLGAGIGLGAMGFDLTASLIIFGIVTAVMTTLGLAVGRFLYRRMAGKKVNGVSGALLFATGCLMLVSRLHAG